MIYCLNPNCPKPQNSDNLSVCTSCGTKLTSLLRGRYRVIRAIGSGGFGKTYLAEDEDRRKANCVVKQFAPAPGMRHPEVLPKAKELFNQEAERLLHLEDHSQIPTLYAYFEESNYLYLVQQFVKGQTLLEELKQYGNFSQTKIRELLEDLLPVLDFVHQRRVIHRDIKPENIMRRQSDGKLVLIDFGVAKQGTGTFLTKQGTTVGTLGYAPMEQVMRGVVYPASDLYSLAVTCIRLMTGCFVKNDRSDELYDNIEGGWVWREHLPNETRINVELGQILDKLLKDYPKERYQSASEVLAALNDRNTPQVAVAKSLKPNATPSTTSTANIPQNSLQSFKFDVVTVDARGREINQQRHQAEFFAEDLGKGAILEMVYIPSGTFLMGSPNGEGNDRERPQHRVTVSSFFMGKYAVTQNQWEAVMATNPSNVKGAKRPVEKVSWDETLEFCARLSQKTGKTYRLPSEAEWEYVARAGTTTPFHFGETITPDLVNYDGNNPYGSAAKGLWRQQTTDVGSFGPNAFGLYDMHGNVWEWCSDRWHDNYNGAPSDGSSWETGGDDRRVLRGGSCYFYAVNCRSANRYRYSADNSIKYFGFRVAVAFVPSAS